MFDLAVILGLGILYPIVHLANGWLFAFAEISPNVGLIYLPAFLRLLNVLLLGKVRGTLAGLLGGLLLALGNTHDDLFLKAVNMVCSVAGPVIAVVLFEHWRKRPVRLVSLSDLTELTIIYCLANSLVHHFAWALVAPQNLTSPQQVVWMVIGDLIGTLIGAYLLKWAADQVGLRAPPRA